MWEYNSIDILIRGWQLQKESSLNSKWRVFRLWSMTVLHFMQICPDISCSAFFLFYFAGGGTVKNVNNIILNHPLEDIHFI